MLATPGLQEPVYLGKHSFQFFEAYIHVEVTVEIQCPEGSIGGLYRCLNLRRGVPFSEEQRPGTSVWTVKAYLPVVESFGFEADLREHTSGKAYPQSIFDHWETMSGSG